MELEYINDFVLVKVKYYSANTIDHIGFNPPT